MSIIIGPPVSGDNFFGRKEYIDKIIKLILAGIHILLTGPRRVGKTSLSLNIIKLLKERGWNCVYITLEGAHDIPAFVNRFIEAMKKEKSFWEKAGEGFTRFYKAINIDISLGPVKVSKNADDHSDVLLLEALSRSIQNLTGNILIVVDELPIFLRALEKNQDSKVKPDQVLEFLRSIRQLNTQDDDSNMVWLFSGSISLEYFAAARNLSYAINDLQSNQLSAFSASDSKNYIDHLSAKHEILLGEDQKQYILDLIEWHVPFYINIVADGLLDTGKSQTIDFDYIDRAYKDSITKYKKEFDYQLQRLNNDHDHPDLIIRILKFLAKNKKGDLDEIKSLQTGTEWTNITEERLLNLLDILENDGYILFHEKVYIFRSPLLRDYITNKFHL